MYFKLQTNLVRRCFLFAAIYLQAENVSFFKLPQCVKFCFHIRNSASRLVIDIDISITSRMFLSEGNVVLRGRESLLRKYTYILTLNGESRCVQTILLKATILHSLVWNLFTPIDWLTNDKSYDKGICFLLWKCFFFV